MSTEEGAVSRKEKKAQRDAQRAQQKGKKRKRAEAPEPDALPKQDEPEETVVVAETVTPAERKSKKRKAGDIFEDTTADPAVTTATTAADDDKDATEQPTKKRRKSKKTSPTTTNEDGTAATKESAKSRFIVFVGNLPYKTTDTSLQKHFAKLQPFTLRHRTDPKTKKSKGFAFLEFENYDRMKTCLKIYHHSMFDPEAIDSGRVEGGPDAGALPVASGANTNTSAGNVNGFHPERQNRGRKGKETARKINVELTAGGGGGKSDGRKEKIKEKNVRLNEQRERRAELEKKEALKKAGKDKKVKKTVVNADLPEKEETESKTEKIEGGAIHPARLAMMGR